MFDDFMQTGYLQELILAPEVCNIIINTDSIYKRFHLTILGGGLNKKALISQHALDNRVWNDVLKQK